MAKPPTLLPDRAYIHVSTSKPPESIAQSMSAHPEWNIHYLGPVGELQGEHLFEVRQAGQSSVVERSTVQDGDVVSAVKEATGEKGVKMVEMKQRAKRDEF